MDRYPTQMIGQSQSLHLTAHELRSSTVGGTTALLGVLFVSLLGLAAIYGTTIAVGVATITAPLFIIGGGAIVIVAWRDWEAGIKALLVILIVEGAVRKWFLPFASEWVYFYKDFLMAVIVVSYLAKKGRTPLLIKHELKLFCITLAAFSLYVVAAVSNPGLPHPLVGLLGIKAYLLYAPLVFLVPRMFTSKEKLIAFLKWYLIIALPVVALSAMQFIDSDPNSALNRYAWDEKTAAATGMEMQVANFQDSAGNNYVRVTGPFSYLSGLAIYLPTIFALLLGFISQHQKKSLPKGFRWIYHGALGSVATAVFMTGSRGAVLNLFLSTLVFYALASKKDLLRRLRQAAIAVVFTSISLTVFFPQAYDALNTRAFGGEDEVIEGRGRIVEAFRLPFDEAAYAGAFGYGVGATHNAVPIMMSKLTLPFVGEVIPIGYESESGRVMLELGVVGFALHLFLRLSILMMLLYACLSIRDAGSKSLAVAAFVALLFPLVIGGAVVQHTQSVYQWFLIGIPLAMLNAEKLAKRHDPAYAANGKQ